MTQTTIAADTTDAELVRDALAGSQAAFAHIFDRYQDHAQSFAARMVNDRALGEDLAQEAFLHAFGRLATYDPQRRFSSWLLQIVHHVTVDYLRIRRPSLVSLESLETAGDKDWSPTAQGPSPYRQAEMASLLAALNSALRRIKPEYRKILRLRYQDELSIREIAVVLGLREGTVAVHLSRASQELLLFLRTD